MLCVLIRIALLRQFYWVHSTYNYCVENRKKVPKLSLFASWPGAMINPQWLKLPLSRTNFHGPKDVWAIKVWLYIKSSLILQPNLSIISDLLQWHANYNWIQVLTSAHLNSSFNVLMVNANWYSHQHVLRSLSNWNKTNKMCLWNTNMFPAQGQCFL